MDCGYLTHGVRQVIPPELRAARPADMVKFVSLVDQTSSAVTAMVVEEGREG